MKVSKITSVTETLDLKGEKKQPIRLPKEKPSRITGYVLAGLMLKSASALFPELYAFSLTKNIFKAFRMRKKKNPEL